MIKGLIALGIMALSLSVGAVTWYRNGVLYGNVCRYGAFYTVYPAHMGQPVGTMCPLRDNFGNIIGTGLVSAE